MVTGDLLKNLLKGKTIAVGAIVSFLISYSLFFGFLCDRQITGFKAYYPLVFILVWAASFLLCVLLWALIDRINLKVSKKDEKAEEEILLRGPDSFRTMPPKNLFRSGIPKSRFGEEYQSFIPRFYCFAAKSAINYSEILIRG